MAAVSYGIVTRALPGPACTYLAVGLAGQARWLPSTTGPYPHARPWPGQHQCPHRRPWLRPWPRQRPCQRPRHPRPAGRRHGRTAMRRAKRRRRERHLRRLGRARPDGLGGGAGSGGAGVKGGAGSGRVVAGGGAGSGGGELGVCRRVGRDGSKAASATEGSPSEAAAGPVGTVSLWPAKPFIGISPIPVRGGDGCCHT